jgi:hypothetical protein
MNISSLPIGVLAFKGNVSSPDVEKIMECSCIFSYLNGSGIFHPCNKREILNFIVLCCGLTSVRLYEITGHTSEWLVFGESLCRCDFRRTSLQKVTDGLHSWGSLSIRFVRGKPVGMSVIRYKLRPRGQESCHLATTSYAWYVKLWVRILV